MAMAQTAFRTRPAYYRHGTAAARRSQKTEMPLFQAFLRPSSVKVTDGLCIKDATTIDPCCGSGGMFIQSAELVKAKRGDISRINVYGQEKEPATYRLAKMNLALRGISHNLGAEADSSFTHDLHRGIYFDYIICSVELNLPPLSVQQKYVDIYKAMVANQQSYERGLEDLKLVCDGYIEDLRRKMPCEKISRAAF